VPAHDERLGVDGAVELGGPDLRERAARRGEADSHAGALGVEVVDRPVGRRRLRGVADGAGPEGVGVAVAGVALVGVALAATMGVGVAAGPVGDGVVEPQPATIARRAMGSNA